MWRTSSPACLDIDNVAVAAVEAAECVLEMDEMLARTLMDALLGGRSNMDRRSAIEFSRFF